MTEAEMRAAFIGKKFQGYYHHGMTWTASYRPDGTLDYVHNDQPATGQWRVLGSVFCVFYRLPDAMGGGCINVIRLSSNCFEYYRTQPLLLPDIGGGQRTERSWHSRGWRQGEPPTCDEKPTA